MRLASAGLSERTTATDRLSVVTLFSRKSEMTDLRCRRRPSIV